MPLKDLPAKRPREESDSDLLATIKALKRENELLKGKPPTSTENLGPNYTPEYIALLNKQ